MSDSSSQSGKYVSFLVGDRMVHVPESAVDYFKSNVSELFKLAALSQPNKGKECTPLSTIVIPVNNTEEASGSDVTELQEPEHFQHKTSITWTEDLTRQLLAAYKKHIHMFNDASSRRKGIWTKVSETLAISGMKVTPNQCEIRWKEITSIQRDSPSLSKQSASTKDLSEMLDDPPTTSRKVKANSGMRGDHSYVPLNVPAAEAPPRTRRTPRQHAGNNNQDEDFYYGSDPEVAAGGAYNSRVGIKLDSATMKTLGGWHKERMAVERQKIQVQKSLHKEKLRALKDIIFLLKEVRNNQHGMGETSSTSNAPRKKRKLSDDEGRTTRSDSRRQEETDEQHEPNDETADELESDAELVQNEQNENEEVEEEMEHENNENRQLELVGEMEEEKEEHKPEEETEQVTVEVTPPSLHSDDDVTDNEAEQQ